VTEHAAELVRREAAVDAIALDAIAVDAVPVDPDAIDATVRPTWRRSAAIEVAIVVALVIATVGMLTSRVDVVLIALPLLASAAISLDRKPSPAARRAVRVNVTRSLGDERTSAFDYAVEVDATPAAELVHLRLTLRGSRTHELILAPVGTVSGRVPVLYSGRLRVVAVDYRLVGVNGAWLSRPVRDVVERVVAPAIAPVASIPLPHRLTGLTGTHGSARPGDGGEFRDLHPYAPGDRLRRIDWKATARRSQGFGDLYVRRTDATSDATLILVIDSREDVGERVEHWSAGPSDADGLGSMDLAREAAASLAAAAIGVGDRVGLIDIAAHDGVVRAGSGKRHLDRLLRRIAACEPSGPPLNRRRAPIVPAGAIVYLISTFLDDEATSIAVLWRAAGHRVIAVDVLPAPRLDRSEGNTHLAHRIVMIERRRRIADVRSNGVEVFRWQEDAEQPSRAVVLRTLARVGRRRR
jgi:uncharacterized protein (DUF58 family)